LAQVCETGGNNSIAPERRTLKKAVGKRLKDLAKTKPRRTIPTDDDDVVLDSAIASAREMRSARKALMLTELFKRTRTRIKRQMTRDPIWPSP
jgi:hypothetical protein